MTKYNYKPKFRKEWLYHESLKDWILEVPDDISKAHCRYCRCSLKSKLCDLVDHSKTKKHQAAAEPVSSKNQNWMQAVSGDDYSVICKYCCCTLKAQRSSLVDHCKTKKHLKIANSYGDTDASFLANLNDHVDITDTENFESSCTVNEEEVSSEEYATPEKKKKIITINANEIRVPERSFKASNFYKSSVTPPPLEEDNDVIFGKFLINELKSLKNEEIKSKLKRKILNMVWNADEGKVDAILSQPFPVFVSSENPIPLVKPQFTNGMVNKKITANHEEND